MPKLKHTLSAEEQFRSRIVGLASILTGGLCGLAPRVGISDKTMYRRMKQPDDLTIRDLRGIRKALDIEKAEYMEMLCKLL